MMSARPVESTRVNELAGETGFGLVMGQVGDEAQADDALLARRRQGRRVAPSGTFA